MSKQKGTRRPRRAKSTEGTRVEANKGLENQLTQKPDIPDIFIPREHKVDPHKERSNIQTRQEGVAATQYSIF